MKTKNYKIPFIFFYYFLKILLGMSVFVSFIRQDWENLFFTLAIFLLTFLPTLIKKRYRIYIPIEFDFFVVSFIFLSLFLGEIYDYYNKIWWWDLYLHTQAGFLLGMFGFLLVYILNEQRNFSLKLSPRFVSLFAFTFAITAGVVWEIFEFFMDQAFGLNMQKSGLVDTMWDLIVDVIGAGAISIIGYFWQKNKINFSWLENSITEILKSTKD